LSASTISPAAASSRTMPQIRAAVDLVVPIAFHLAVSFGRSSTPGLPELTAARLPRAPRRGRQRG
jgi:hypothetical protein